MVNTRDEALQSSILIADVRNTFLVILAAIILPILVHLIPSYSTMPVGAVWLPVFWAPFIAIYLFKPRIGIIAGILAPVVNAAVTGRPEMMVVGMLTAELAVFTIIATLLYKRFKDFPGVAPIAYLVAKLFSAVALGMIPPFALEAARVPYYFKALFTAIPGLGVLLVINFLVIRYKRREG